MHGQSHLSWTSESVSRHLGETSEQACEKPVSDLQPVGPQKRWSEWTELSSSSAPAAGRSAPGPVSRGI
jgi:hypothetical protein